MRLSSLTWSLSFHSGCQPCRARANAKGSSADRAGGQAGVFFLFSSPTPPVQPPASRPQLKDCRSGTIWAAIGGSFNLFLINSPLPTFFIACDWSFRVGAPADRRLHSNWRLGEETRCPITACVSFRQGPGRSAVVWQVWSQGFTPRSQHAHNTPGVKCLAATKLGTRIECIAGAGSQPSDDWTIEMMRLQVSPLGDQLGGSSAEYSGF